MSSSATLLESAAAAARVDPREVDGEELMVMELDAVRAVSLLEAHVARVGAELEARGTTDTVHGLRTGSWVAREAPTSPAAVRLRIRAAQTVARHWPLVEEAWLAGDLSWEHIRALLAASNPRVVEAIAGIQEPIIELAKGCGFEQWKTDIASLIRLLDQDGPDPKPGDGLNRLSWKTTLDGVLDVQATLQHDLGLVLRTAVDRRADELFRAFTRDHEQCPDIVVPSRAELCAMALIDLVRTGVAAEPGDGRARVEVTLIHHADHNGTCEHECGCTGPTAADAECDEGDEGDEGDDEGRSGEGSCDAAPTGGSRGGTGTPNAPATRSGTDTRHGEAAGPDNRTAELPDNSTVDRAHGPDDTGTRERTRTENGDRTDRTDRPGPAPGRGRDPSARSGWPGLTDLEGHPIRGEQAGVWSCAAERSVLTADRNGVPLHLGRSRRLASPAQRKALAIRDGGCTFPGCEHPAMWTDAHHVTAWEHGGRTDLDQLVSLCRRHHGIAHRAGWVLTLGDDGWTRWTTPSGVTIAGQRHHRRPDDRASDQAIDIDRTIDIRSDNGIGVGAGNDRDGPRARRTGTGRGARASDFPPGWSAAERPRRR
jgi:hypothetical protein